MNLSSSFQKIISSGYLFLVALGIVKEAIFYYPLGINIMKYSSLMDVLISPIADLTSHWIILVAVAVLLLLGYLVYNYLANRPNNAKVARMLNIKEDLTLLSIEQRNEILSLFFVRFFYIMLLSFFLGYGWGGGQAEYNRIKNNDMKFRHTLNYASGESEKIYLVGSNSVYYFYVPQGSQKIKIAPVGAIKSLELTDNKKFEKK